MKFLTKIVVFLLVFSTMSGIVIAKEPRKAYAVTTSEAVIEQKTGRILHCSFENEKKPMASTTKIVTAITAIENYSGNFDEVISVPAQAVGIEGSSIYLKWGDRLPFRDLLYGLMLRSGNDCAVAIATIVGGSIEGFAEMMNATSERAGATNSHFVNPHGLHDDNHYTTAIDLAKITAYAMNNDMFCDIVSCKEYVLRFDDSRNEVIYNKNKLLRTYDGANGVKTGFTSTAGRCFVSSATRNGMTVIAVVLNCPDMFNRCANLMNGAFNDYVMTDLTPHGIISYCAVAGCNSIAPLGAEEEFFYPLKKDGSDNVGYETCDIGVLGCETNRAVANGKLNIYLNKQLLFSTKLVIIK